MDRVGASKGGSKIGWTKAAAAYEPGREVEKDPRIPNIVCIRSRGRLLLKGSKMLSYR